MFFTRLFRPFIARDGDELSGGATPVEAPDVDQPDTPDVTPEATAPGTSAPEGDTPTSTEAPETPEEQFTDLDVTDLPEEVQARHREMQADYTRKTQELAERNRELDNAVSFVTDLVSDEPNETMEAVFKTLAGKLGYDIEGDDDTPEGTDTVDQPAEPVDERQAKIDALLAREDAREQEAAEAAQAAHLDTVETEITDGITALAKADGIDLTEAELDVIFDGVLALPPEGDGPAVKAAYERYRAATKAHTDRWVQSKTSTKAPSGHAADEPVDFANEEARLAYTARAVEAAQRAQAGNL